MTEGRRHLHPRSASAPGQAAHRGKPATTSDIRLIDENDRELPPGTTDIAGRSGWPLAGNDDQLSPAGRKDTREGRVGFDTTGARFIRTGDDGPL